MSLRIENWGQAEVDAVKKSKDTNFISRMVKTLAKLETKYLGPRHIRKGRHFTKKHNSSPMTSKERAPSINHVLAAPKPLQINHSPKRSAVMLLEVKAIKGD